MYNCERYLGEAIESVLAQTYQPLEVIVVDDGSTDGSASVAKSFDSSIHYCYQTNSGASAARNHGTDLAQGSFLAFLDADDVWVKDKLRLQMAAFEDNPELDIVFGQVKQFHSPELDESIKQKIHCPTELMSGYFPGAMLLKRDSFFRIGLFKTNWKIGEFVDWYSRAIEQGLRSCVLPKALLKRRLHETNMGINERQSRTDYARILKASLDRRRAKGQLV